MYKLKQGFIVQKKDNSVTLFDGEKSLLYTFNESASYIFEQIKKGLNGEEIIKKITKKYKISKKEANKDFRKLLNDLKRKKIIL